VLLQTQHSMTRAYSFWYDTLIIFVVLSGGAASPPNATSDKSRRNNGERDRGVAEALDTGGLHCLLAPADRLLKRAPRKPAPVRGVGGVLDGVGMSAEVLFVDRGDHLGLLDEVLRHAAADVDDAGLLGLLDHTRDLVGIGELVDIDVDPAPARHHEADADG